MQFKTLRDFVALFVLNLWLNENNTEMGDLFDQFLTMISCGEF